jgi:hypothetical protein
VPRKRAPRLVYDHTPLAELEVQNAVGNWLMDPAFAPIAARVQLFEFALRHLVLGGAKTWPLTERQLPSHARRVVRRLVELADTPAIKRAVLEHVFKDLIGVADLPMGRRVVVEQVFQHVLDGLDAGVSRR